MTFRLYFNRCEDWPQIWSIDSGDASTECNVVGWRIEHGVTAVGARADSLATVDRQREPVAWMAIDAASLRIENGVAVFRDALSES